MVISGFIFSIEQSAMALLTHNNSLSDWWIYLSALDTIGWSKMNERLPDSSTRGVAKCLYIARERKKNQMSNFKYIDLKVTLPKVCEYK